MAAGGAGLFMPSSRSTAGSVIFLVCAGVIGHVAYQMWQSRVVLYPEHIEVGRAPRIRLIPYTQVVSCVLSRSSRAASVVIALRDGSNVVVYYDRGDLVRFCSASAKLVSAANSRATKVSGGFR